MKKASNMNQALAERKLHVKGVSRGTIHKLQCTHTHHNNAKVRIMISKFLCLLKILEHVMLSTRLGFNV